MDNAPDDLPLLNIYEIDDAEKGRTRHLIGFMDPVLAGAIGIVSHAMVGEFTPRENGDFDPESFIVNPEFVQVVIRYMNLQPIHSSQLAQGAREIPGQKLYVVDPRAQVADHEDPPAEDILGWYQVDSSGELPADSFHYNVQHAWFSLETGLSGLLRDPMFYAFVHPEAHKRVGTI